MLHATIHAFDKDSSEFFGKSLAIETKEDLEKQYKEFAEKVPFSRWFYEIDVDHDLTPEEDKILDGYEWAFYA